MAKLTPVKIEVSNPAYNGDNERCISFTSQCTVDVEGRFTLSCPENIYLLFDDGSVKGFDDIHTTRKKVTFGVVGPDLARLKKALTAALETSCKPTVTQSLVIAYNVESHVSFAADKKGNIFPNATWPDTNWVKNDDFYGYHHATQRSEGGYSLTVGARAYTKTITTFGGAEKITYEIYYGPAGNHHARDNPAALLNSWQSFNLPEDCKEMPYTDEAAVYFHNMMLGMADLSRRIQEFMHDEPKLLAAIKKGVPLLSAPSKGK